MSRYIDADLAPIFLSKTVCKQLEQIPTADVQKVRHGEWLNECEHSVLPSKKIIEWNSKRCSECGGKQTHKTNYCSNCGTKMDKE